jgi:hypothetical protein
MRKSMPPSRILIVRHGEKPGDPGQDQPGDGDDLSTRGFARAAAMAFVLTEKFGPFDYLFAAARSHHSNRPIETLAPLSAQIRMDINDEYADDNYQNVANQLLSNGDYRGKSVLVCWHHGKIPKLAAALGVLNPPNPWPAEIFDRIWIMTFTGNTVIFDNKPQSILFGDSAT